MAKDKKKDHAHTKAKKQPGRRKALAAAAAAALVDAPDPAGSEPDVAKARIRSAHVAAPRPVTARSRSAPVTAPDPASASPHPNAPRPAAPRPAATRRRPTRVAAPDPVGGEHHAAKAHGRPTQVDTSLPDTRPELMALHAAARARRNAAALGSPDFRAAITDLERIEIRIAAVDRAADPPLG